MKSDRLAVKASLNSFFVILGAFTVLQTVSYARDAVLLQFGSMGSFLSSFVLYIGTRVLPVLFLFLIFIYRHARLIERQIKQVRDEQAASDEQRAQAVRLYTSFKGLVLGLNLFGFGVGYVLDLILLGKISSIFEPDRLAQLMFNLSGGALYAIAQISINGLIFSGAREVLQIRSLHETKREMGIRPRLIIVTALMATYAMLFVYRNTNVVVQHEIIYAESIEEGLSGSLSRAEIEDLYAEKTAALLAESSSRLQLSADQIVFPDGGSMDRYTRARRSSLIMFLFALAIVTGIETATSTDIRRQLRLIAARIRNVSSGDGDLTARIPIIQGDEIGEISDEFNTFMDSMSSLVGNVMKVAKAVGYSSDSMRDALMGASGAAEESFAATEAVQQSTEGQINIAQEAQGAFDSLFNSIQHISTSVDDQASSVDETSSAMEEMAASINSVSSAAEHASDTAKALSRVAEEGGKAIRDAIDSMQSIKDSSRRVANIVGIISDLTEQTNLLAMNAAIEAAHAGTEGRGFAVVASEVKRLAEDAGNQAEQAFGQMDEMSKRIEHGVKLSDSAGGALQRISEDIARTVALIEEISAAMKEQASGTNQIVLGVTSVVDATHEIKEQTASQTDEGTRIRDYMKHLVEVSSTIRSATAEQAVGNKEVLEAVQKVLAEAGKNEEEVSTLHKEVGRFKVETSETT